ncbi:hypothetical protein WG66_012459 [Moniliophthora roreri]|nr:hypothetical protein WG66_012459 [Moniliophthora roreri]
MPDFDTYAEFLTFLRPFPALKDIKLRSIKLFGNKPSTESKFAATSITLPATLSPYTSSISWKQMLSKPSLPAQIHPADCYPVPTNLWRSICLLFNEGRAVQHLISRLRVIRFKVEESKFLVPFIKHPTKEKTSSEAHLETLDILSSSDVKRRRWDKTFQHPVFSRLDEIITLKSEGFEEKFAKCCILSPLFLLSDEWGHPSVLP